jgi:hypothetical protein
MAICQIESLGQKPGRPERASMLRGAKSLAADPSLVYQAFVGSLLREHALAPQRGAEMAEALVTKLAIDESDVVAEIAGRPGDKIACCRWRIDEAPVGPADEPERLERGQQRNQPVFGNAGRLCERGGRGRPLRDMSKEIELKRGEQRLGRHEAISDRRDIFDVFDQSWPCLGRHRSPPPTGPAAPSALERCARQQRALPPAPVRAEARGRRADARRPLRQEPSLCRQP